MAGGSAKLILTKVQERKMRANGGCGIGSSRRLLFSTKFRAPPLSASLSAGERGGYNLYEIPLEWVYAAHSNHARGPCPHTERRQKDPRAVKCYRGVGTSRPVCAFHKTYRVGWLR